MCKMKIALLVFVPHTNHNRNYYRNPVDSHSSDNDLARNNGHLENDFYLYLYRDPL